MDAGTQKLEHDFIHRLTGDDDRLSAALCRRGTVSLRFVGGTPVDVRVTVVAGESAQLDVRLECRPNAVVTVPTQLPSRYRRACRHLRLHTADGSYCGVTQSRRCHLHSQRCRTFYTIRYDTIRDAILTCARKPTRVSLIYRTETTTKSLKQKKIKSKNLHAQK